MLFFAIFLIAHKIVKLTPSFQAIECLLYITKVCVDKKPQLAFYQSVTSWSTKTRSSYFVSLRLKFICMALGREVNSTLEKLSFATYALPPQMCCCWILGVILEATQGAHIFVSHRGNQKDSVNETIGFLCVFRFPHS